MDCITWLIHHVDYRLGIQSWREISSGGTRTKIFEYHWIIALCDRAINMRGTDSEMKIVMLAPADKLPQCQPYAPAAIYSPETFLRFWYLLLLEAGKTPGPSATGRMRWIEKCN
jgi:hypothetical protein